MAFDPHGDGLHGCEISSCGGGTGKISIIHMCVVGVNSVVVVSGRMTRNTVHERHKCFGFEKLDG